ncbi:MAG: AraC family transcriptional regulator [Tabrizicola sp.]|nr:AraC family transcriptional regulator [Tabrizicola sp.]
MTADAFAISRISEIPGLAGLVHRIGAYDVDAVNAVGDREVASFVVPIIISFADPFRIAFDREPEADDRIGSFVSGLHAGYVDIAYGGPVSCLQIDLTPIGGRLFFGRPMAELATRLVPLDDVEDPGLNALSGQLGEAATQPERLRIAVAFLEHRLLGQAVAPEVNFIWSAILRSRGTLRIDRLTEDLGWSRKRLAAHARDAFGMTPKRLARVARFQHATDLAQSAQYPDWAGIAAACGYSDQAHLVRDFNAFAGETPERWCSRQNPQPTKQNDNTDEGHPV